MTRVSVHVRLLAAHIRSSLPIMLALASALGILAPACCAPLEPAPDVALVSAGQWSIPDAAIDVDDANARLHFVISQVRAAWNKAGLPEVSECAAPLWVATTTDEVEAYCGRPSVACVGFTSGVALAYYDATQTRFHDYDVLAHETIHAFELCAFGDPDAEHTGPGFHLTELLAEQTDEVSP